MCTELAREFASKISSRHFPTMSEKESTAARKKRGDAERLLDEVYLPASNRSSAGALSLTNRIPFPMKLFQMLSDVEKNGNENIVSWSQNGKSFRVHRTDDFVKKVMPHYFRQTRYKSFQRQLHLYGFIRITSGPNKGAYSHVNLVKDNKNICKEIVPVKRKAQEGKKLSAVSKEVTSHGKMGALDSKHEPQPQKGGTLLPHSSASDAPRSAPSESQCATALTQKPSTTTNPFQVSFLGADQFDNNFVFPRDSALSSLDPGTRAIIGNAFPKNEQQNLQTGQSPGKFGMFAKGLSESNINSSNSEQQQLHQSSIFAAQHQQLFSQLPPNVLNPFHAFESHQLQNFMPNSVISPPAVFQSSQQYGSSENSNALGAHLTGRMPTDNQFFSNSPLLRNQTPHQPFAMSPELRGLNQQFSNEQHQKIPGADRIPLLADLLPQQREMSRLLNPTYSRLLDSLPNANQSGPSPRPDASPTSGLEEEHLGEYEPRPI